MSAVSTVIKCHAGVDSLPRCSQLLCDLLFHRLPCCPRTRSASDLRAPGAVQRTLLIQPPTLLIQIALFSLALVHFVAFRLRFVTAVPLCHCAAILSFHCSVMDDSLFPLVFLSALLF